MALTNAQSIYEYLMEQPLPEQWSTPASLKKSYKTANQALNTYQKQIEARLKKYADIRPVTATSQYGNLLDLYNKQYQQQAALAAGETVRASEGTNAGYGDTYSQAATEQAYSSHMADRGTAVPNLMAAAADSVNADKNALAAGIGNMQNQRDIRTAALQSLFNSQFSGIQKEVQARQNASNTLLSSLADLYAYQYGVENGGSSGGSGGSGRRRSSGYGSGSGYSYTGGSGTGNDEIREAYKQAEAPYTTAYSEAIRNYPSLAGRLMTYNEYARNHDVHDYQAYVREMIAMVERSQRLNNSRGGRR